MLALPLFRAGAPVCPLPLTGHIDRGAGDAHPAEMWRHQSWRFQPWQATATVLAHFGPTGARARKAYRAFVAAGLPLGRRPALQGGGLVRSLGGWQVVAALRRGREAYQGDERVLGSSAFVADLQRRLAAADPAPGARWTLAALIARVCQHVGLAPEQLTGRGRRPGAVTARAGIAYLWVEVLGHAGRPLAPSLGVQPAAIPKAAQRGAAGAARWRQLLHGPQES